MKLQLSIIFTLLIIFSLKSQTNKTLFLGGVLESGYASKSNISYQNTDLKIFKSQIFPFIEIKKKWIFIFRYFK